MKRELIEFEKRAIWHISPIQNIDRQIMNQFKHMVISTFNIGHMTKVKKNSVITYFGTIYVTSKSYCPTVSILHQSFPQCTIIMTMMT